MQPQEALWHNPAVNNPGEPSAATSMLRCVYINLDRAVKRREALEASFARHAGPGFELARFAAVNAADDASNLVPGKARAADRACFMSHRQVIMEHPKDGPPLMVLEDDATFGPTFFRVIGGLLDRSPDDILFTDICVPNAGLMSELARERPRLAAAGRIATVGLRKAAFAAAAAYIVLPRALPKLQGILARIERLDGPYDMVLRNLVHRGALSASVTFPFLTTLSEHSEVSAIQPDASISTDLVWNTFRKVMWADRDLAQCSPLLEQIRTACCSPESLMLAPILCAQADAKFVRK